jgi:hypothetical protein
MATSHLSAYAFNSIISTIEKKSQPLQHIHGILKANMI